MNITYLGHAGFIAETNDVVVIMDPWLSPTGAFDASWFQLPRNHHLASLVYEKLQDPRRPIFLYISHEHQDHLDIEFLNSLPARRFTLLLPAFSRSVLMSRFSDYACEELIFFHHKQMIQIPGGFLKFYVDDSQLNRDSAILIKAGGNAFLNLNDCKLFDTLAEIVQEEGPIKVFACQFSGATWHPTCYDYPVDKYETYSKKKYLAKFESVAKAIEVIRPDVYIPSAGPPCFLDPMLFHLNHQHVNIFPRANKIIQYLDQRLRNTSVFAPEMMPGDVLNASSCRVISFAERRFDEMTAEAYLAEYAASYSKYFEERLSLHGRANEEQNLEALRGELEIKLRRLSLADRVTSPLYFRLGEEAKPMLRVDFGRRVVEYVSGNNDSKYYEISAPAWQIAKVLNHELTWEEFALTFRLRLKRDPDVYDPILHAFLVMEAEDLGGYCDLLLQLEAQEERFIVEAEGRKFSVRRYCPHQGGDLSCGWIDQGRFLTCPRHRWQFDLLSGGQCTTNAMSVQAVCLEVAAEESSTSCPSEIEADLRHEVSVQSPDRT
ncbi:Rieske 2Fe-2S domain-containing protein [Edaphobacter modestus]|uniref:UDP-MurNAc hydroxylase n=1 Tax=Edaphobacter modestus TaxID=388466 RepID=A0A4Q7YNJ1_9BACT|nr:Rieske 2Fe-2S domain-containing protein [Edaphobacter modestus]RZU38918.1 UDP-MurNAc hydroxylase [Edaphobacter modestus]